MAWTSVITNAGAALIASWVKGDAPIQITRAAGGDDIVSEAALLAQTALKHEVQSAEIVQKQDVENGQEIKLQFPAAEKSFTLRQIGIFAGNILVAIFQNSTGVSIQSKEENPNFLFSFYSVLAVSSEAEFSVMVSMDAFVTMDVLENSLRGKANLSDIERLSEQILQDLSGKADLEDGMVRYGQLPVMGDEEFKDYIGI